MVFKLTIALNPISSDPSVCTATKNLYDGNSYVRTACLLCDRERNFDTTEALCRNNGMQLFHLDDNTREKLYAYAESRFGRNRGTLLWVNGRDGNSGDCGVISNAGGGFWNGIIPCSTEMCSYCEYILQRRIN